MKRTPIHSERNFARELTRLVHDYAGRLHPGQRAFWLLSAAIATLHEENGGHSNAFGFKRAAERVYQEVERYL